MCGGVSSGASSVCSSSDQSQQTSCKAKKWDGKVLVEFSPVKLRVIKECGVAVSNESKDGDTAYVEEYINVLEWEYYRVNHSRQNEKLAFDDFIFVNCSDTKGIELYNTCAENANVPLSLKKDSKVKAGLIGKLEFALGQLKDYLFKLEKKDGYANGGEVRLYICAIHPFECLMFAFQKIFGFAVEEELDKDGPTYKNNDDTEVYSDEIYKGFMNDACNNRILSQTKEWFNQHHWKVNLEYCGVHQVYLEQATILTEQGKKNKRKKEINDLMAVLKGPTDKITQTYNKIRPVYQGYNEKADKEYQSLLSQWKANVGEVKKVWEWAPYGQSHYSYMEYPALEYEGEYRAYPDLENILKEMDVAEANARKEASKTDVMKKRAESMKKQAEKEEKELYDAKVKEADEIHDKLDELEKRKTSGTEESKLWEERYDQDHNTSDLDKEEQRNLIEYQGEMLNEDQLREKLAEVVDEFSKKNKEILKAYNDATAILKKIDKNETDKWLTIAQVAAGVAAIALTIAFPPAAIGIMAVASTVSIGCEVAKWSTDDNWTDNWGSHTASIAIDLVSFAFIPLFGSISKTAKLAQAVDETGKMITSTERSLANLSKTTKATRVEAVFKDTAAASKEAAPSKFAVERSTSVTVTQSKAPKTRSLKEVFEEIEKPVDLSKSKAARRQLPYERKRLLDLSIQAKQRSSYLDAPFKNRNVKFDFVVKDFSQETGFGRLCKALGYDNVYNLSESFKLINRSVPPGIAIVATFYTAINSALNIYKSYSIASGIGFFFDESLNPAVLQGIDPETFKKLK